MPKVSIPYNDRWVWPPPPFGCLCVYINNTLTLFFCRQLTTGTTAARGTGGGEGGGGEGEGKGEGEDGEGEGGDGDGEGDCGEGDGGGGEGDGWGGGGEGEGKEGGGLDRQGVEHSQPWYLTKCGRR